MTTYEELESLKENLEERFREKYDRPIRIKPFECPDCGRRFRGFRIKPKV